MTIFIQRRSLFQNILLLCYTFFLPPEFLMKTLCLCSKLSWVSLTFLFIHKEWYRNSTTFPQSVLIHDVAKLCIELIVCRQEMYQLTFPQMWFPSLMVRSSWKLNCFTRVSDLPSMWVCLSAEWVLLLRLRPWNRLDVKHVPGYDPLFIPFTCYLCRDHSREFECGYWGFNG